MELYLMELVLGWPDKYLELTRTLLYPEFFNRIYCWSIELIEQEQIKPLKYMIIMRSEGKFLRHFKEAAPLAVSTFGSKIGHLTLRMILYSSSKKVGLVAHHYRHFVRANMDTWILKILTFQKIFELLEMTKSWKSKKMG